MSRHLVVSSPHEGAATLCWSSRKGAGPVATIDVPEYYIDNLPKVMGILRQIVETA